MKIIYLLLILMSIGCSTEQQQEWAQWADNYQRNQQANPPQEYHSPQAQIVPLGNSYHTPQSVNSPYMECMNRCQALYSYSSCDFKCK